MEAALIFPHQLFESNPIIKENRKIYLIEEYLFFDQYAFHKQKIAFHRASMKAYEYYLSSSGINVHYIESRQSLADIRNLITKLNETYIFIIDPVDNYLMRRIEMGCQQANKKLFIEESPAFLNSRQELSSFFRSDKKKFFQTEFYIQQRKLRQILTDEAGNPLGGKWSFDAENRKKYPANTTPPAVTFPLSDSHYEEAKSYIASKYSENPGRLNTSSLYPYTFASSRKWLDDFLENRFYAFGDYEDAIVSQESFLHHSLLSPLINVGLLTPDEIIASIINHANENQIGLNNTEGLVRQIIGWREFIRGVYEVKGVEERTRNFWGFKRKIPSSFYDGTTGIEPVDITIKKVLKTGYCHHIERLMVLGNFMLLCEFDPDEVYRWFMELFIDAYDWVMVPNVYGMSQFADGGLMSTKPYISGSNYLMKMSNYRKGDWQVTWDALFWRFMHVHRDFFLSNPRIGMLVKTFDKMSEEKKKAHLEVAESYLSKL